MAIAKAILKGAPSEPFIGGNGFDVPGIDLVRYTSVDSEMKCKQLCTVTSKCNVYVYGERVGNCWLRRVENLEPIQSKLVNFGWALLREV